ncbi:hypothetical protein LSH36_129g05063 [Paralvinella palmiformis]|uniref:SoHo domain-containing protein n=1 Tax=Paralvinella palmiformis TaxID=53620 RepID=A0AAD9JWX4_9ANNE|nr:hypothetical protein LSH36_129g05063 [Paralvinella palmiformis]
MKNISNSVNSGPEPDGTGSKDKDKAIPQTTVWSPFGVNKVRTYKPVSFSIIGGTTSPVPTNQNTAAFRTSSSFVGSTQQNVDTGAVSVTSVTTTLTTSSTVTSAVESKETGKNTTTNNETFSSPSYSNFNGNSSVIINASSPGSAYTSITMNSRRVTDGSPTHQYTTFGSAVPVSSPSQSRPFSPPAQQSPVIITPTSSQKSSTSPSSPFPSPFVKGYKPVSPPIPVGKQPTAETKGTSPAGPGFKLGSPPKTSGSEAKLATQPGSPTKPTVANTGPQLMPTSPTKSPMGAFPSSPKGHQRRPASPTKSVTFGPVTALDQKPEETPGAEEPRLSVSQKKSLFEQRQQQEKQEAVQQARLQQRKPMSPVTTPKRFGMPTSPKPFKAPSSFGEKSSPPSNITGGAGYRPVSPRLFSPSRPTSKTLASPYAPPKSPPAKSKGLEMFLTLQRKLHEPDDELSEFTDSEDTPAPKSTAPVTPTKSTVPSPVIGRAVPIKITSQIRDDQDTKSDLGLINSSITKSSTKIISPTSPVTSATEPWLLSKASALIDAELREREREREQQKQEQQDHNKLDSWSPTGSTEASHNQYTALKLNSSSQLATSNRSDHSSSKLGRGFPWKPDQTTTFSSSTVTMTTTTTMATHHTPSTTMSYSSHNGSISHHTESRLPTYQSPTITLLQKSRELKNGNFEIPRDIPAVRVDESEVPKDAILVGTKEIIEGDKKHMDTYYLLPGDKDHSRSRRIVERKTTKYEGIGPTDEVTGVPIIPRGSVDEKAHKDWYRRMYKSLHKVEKQEDINNYKPTYVFPELDSDSEVEEGIGSTMSMDRGGYGRRSYTLPHARYHDTKYKVQPMSIENYEPGFSSIAFRERKADPESVKPPERRTDQKSRSPSGKDDKKSYLYNPPIEKPGQFSKYIYSDSEPELKKKDQPLQPQSDTETREAYKRIQKGGDIPYEGLHFPVPPKKAFVMPTRTVTCGDNQIQAQSASCFVPHPVRKQGAKKFSFTFAELGDPYPFRDVTTDVPSVSSMDCESSHVSEESFDRQYQVYRSYSDSDDLDNLVLYNTVGKFSTQEAGLVPNRSNASGQARQMSKQEYRDVVGLRTNQLDSTDRAYDHHFSDRQDDYVQKHECSLQNKSLEEEAHRPEGHGLN